MYRSGCASHLEPILCGKRCYLSIATYSLTSGVYTQLTDGWTIPVVLNLG